MSAPGGTPAWPLGLSDELIVGALDQLAEAVTVHDTSGRLLYANDAAATLLGFDSVDELIAVEPGELVSRYRVFHPDGRPLDRNELPGRRVMLGEEPEPLLVRWFTLKDAELRWSLIKARALRDESGAVLGAVNVMQDVTVVKEGEFAQRLLADAGAVFATSMDHTQTLQQLAELAVPRLADWCGVDLVDARGAIQQVAVAHVDPEKAEFGREFRRRYPISPGEQSGVPAVIRSGQIELDQDITDEMLAAYAQDGEHLSAIRALGLRSILIVPLLAPRGGVIGALTLAMSGEGRRFSHGDVTLARELGRRAGAAVENARILTERGRIAELLQASLVPSELPSVPGWATATLFRPAGDVNFVGGDFYDARAVDGGLLVCVGDVAGKGASAAGTTGRVRYALMTAVAFTGDLPRAFAHVNSLLLMPGKRGMCTVAAAQLARDDDGARAIIGLAGHPRPVLLRDGEARYIEARGAMFGAFPDATWEVATLELEPGDVLIFYTDGVTDAASAEERFGSERLVDCIRAATPPTAGGIVGALERELHLFERGPQRDDIALLAVEYVR
ncbi:MAG: SpoIIE family protein phosphatase [Solirubrobacteraceae bacterium]